MNLLVVTGIFPPDAGGPASYVPRIATALVARGHTVNVVCWSDHLEHDDSQYAFAVHRIRRKNLRLPRTLKTIQTIAKLARRSELVFVNGLAFEAALVARISQKPTVHKIVGDYAWERAASRGWFHGTIDEYQIVRKGFRLQILDWLRLTPLRHACKVITPSQYLGRLVASWGVPGERVNVIYNAVQPSSSNQVAPLPNYSGMTLMTAGRLVRWKGMHGILHALVGLANARLLIAGDGPLREILTETAAKLSISHRVLFLGHVPHEQMASYLRQANAFILNSSYEGLPHVVLEAMASGIPVIATNAGGTSEVVRHGETGLLVKVGDTEELLRSIRRLQNDPGFGEELAANARQMLSSRFCFQAMVDGTERVLLTAAGKVDSLA